MQLSTYYTILRHLLCCCVLRLLICHPTGISAEQPEECVSADQKPGTYEGQISVAYDGTPCEYWSNHPPFYRRKWTAEEAAQHRNFCRNPDGDFNGPWCVVPNNSFRYCNIPTCGKFGLSDFNVVPKKVDSVCDSRYSWYVGHSIDTVLKSSYR